VLPTSGFILSSQGFTGNCFCQMPLNEKKCPLFHTEMRPPLKLCIKLLEQWCVISSLKDGWLSNQDSVHVHFSSEELELCWTEGSLIQHFCKTFVVEKISRAVSPKITWYYSATIKRHTQNKGRFPQRD
jgi:hypothetical protein